MRLLAVVLVAAVAGVAAQDTGAARFEAVTIKPTVSPVPNGASFGGGGPTRWVVTNGAARNLILSAYPSTTSDLIGAPDWVHNDYYDVVAVSARPATRTVQEAMLRAMLADRFKLQLHTESRQRDGYALVVARDDRRLGSSLRRVGTDCAAYNQALRENRPLPDVSAPTNGSPLCSMSMGRGRLLSGGRTMQELAGSVQGVAGRPIVDRTGLEGDYEFTLDYSAGPEGPSIFTSLEEQLGLKLQPTRVPIEVLVIDHIERPTPD